jgi:hypothetical protein
MKHVRRGHVETTDAEIDAAIARAAIYDEFRPRAIAVTFDDVGDRFSVVLSTGVTIGVPRRLLHGLQSATPQQLADVCVDDYGSALRWESLDVDHFISELLNDILGVRAFMSEIGKKGGSARSDTKTAAVRKNGTKGGRPRRVPAQ